MVISENSRVRAKIHPAFEQLLTPHVAKVDAAFQQGLTSLSWSSLNFDKYVDCITVELGNNH